MPGTCLISGDWATERTGIRKAVMSGFMNMVSDGSFMPLKVQTAEHDGRKN